MGGAIVTLIAEQFAGHYQGAVAVGAALQAHETEGSPRLQSPAADSAGVFLTNQSELDGPRKYVAAPFARRDPTPPARRWRATAT